MICEDCEKDKPDVKVVDCPFAQEVFNEVVECQVCDDCYYKRLMDI